MSQSDEKKPRKFTLYFDENADNPRVAVSSEFALIKFNEIIALIEHSAFKALEEEIQEFKTGVQNFKCFSCGQYNNPFAPVNLLSEIKALEEKLALAVEALEQMVDAISDNNPETPKRHLKIMITVAEANARLALQKIKGDGNE